MAELSKLLGCEYQPETRERRDLTVQVGGIQDEEYGAPSRVLVTVSTKSDTLTELHLRTSEARQLGLWLIQAASCIEAHYDPTAWPGKPLLPATEAARARRTVKHDY